MLLVCEVENPSGHYRHSVRLLIPAKAKLTHKKLKSLNAFWTWVSDSCINLGVDILPSRKLSHIIVKTFVCADFATVIFIIFIKWKLINMKKISHHIRIGFRKTIRPLPIETKWNWLTQRPIYVYAIFIDNALAITCILCTFKNVSII